MVDANYVIITLVGVLEYQRKLLDLLVGEKGKKKKKKMRSFPIWYIDKLHIFRFERCSVYIWIRIRGVRLSIRLLYFRLLHIHAFAN